MFFATGIWCLTDILSVSPSSEQTDQQVHANGPLMAYLHTYIKALARFLSRYVRRRLNGPGLATNPGQVASPGQCWPASGFCFNNSKNP